LAWNCRRRTQQVRPGLHRLPLDASWAEKLYRRTLQADWRDLQAILGRTSLLLFMGSMNKHFHYSSRFGANLEKQGVSSSMVLRRAGLPQDLFKERRILLSTDELFALWQAVGEVSKDPAIGLKLGTAASTQQFHPSCIAALSTESLGAAINHLARHKRLTCPEEMPQEVEGDEWAIRFRWVLASAPEPTALIDMCFRCTSLARSAWIRYKYSSSKAGIRATA